MEARRRSPILILNPASDQEFVGLAEAALAAGATEPPALQEALRATYPRAVVHARELAGEPVAVLYVYRDGHWVNGR